MALNLISPTIFTTAVLIGDNIQTPGGSLDSLPSLTQPGSTALEIQATDAALLVSRLTTSQRDAIAAIPGMIIYNTIDDVFNVYQAHQGWVPIGDSGSGNVFNNTGGGTNGNIAVFSDATGHIIRDSGVNINTTTLNIPLSFSAKRRVSTSLVPPNVLELNNLGVLNFGNSNDINEGFVFVNGEPAFGVFNNGFSNFPTTTVFGFAQPTSDSALVELNSANQCLLISRLNTEGIMGINPPENGMILYNTDTNQFNFRQNFEWLPFGNGSGSVTTLIAGPGLTATPNPIITSGTISLMSTGVTANTYSNPTLMVNQFGQITFAESHPLGGTVTEIDTGTGLTGGPITTSGTISLADSGVTAGTYSFPINMAVNAQGQITAITSDGSDNGSNLFIGHLVGNTTLTGIENIAVGFGSLFHNTTGDGNTAVGSNSLSSNTTGYFNTALGSGSLFRNTMGFQNTALGTDSLSSNTMGSDNTAVGFSSLSSNTMGTQNAALGEASLSSNTIGNDNTALGVDSLVDNTEGNNNTALGSGSLFRNTMGNDNTAVGFGSGQEQINYTRCTFLGSGADASANNRTNACAIGANASVAVSNALVLGNNCKVGIGNSSPAHTLDLGNVSSSCTLFMANTTTAPSMPTGGGILYVSGGALHYLGSSGTNTIVAPA